MYIKPMPTPPGVNPLADEDRMPVIKVFNGDSWEVDLKLVNPVTKLPATPRNTVVRFVLAENRFTPALWEGSWHDGVEPSDVIPGLVHVKIPSRLCESLRRGVYAFSAQVIDDLGMRKETQARGYFQVEYEPTSSTHDIPYRDGSKSDFESEPGSESTLADRVAKLDTKSIGNFATSKKTFLDLIDILKAKPQ